MKMTYKKYSNCNHKHECYHGKCRHYHRHEEKHNPIKQVMTKNEASRRWNKITKEYGNYLKNMKVK